MFGCSFDASKLKMLTTKRRDVKVVKAPSAVLAAPNDNTNEENRRIKKPWLVSATVHMLTPSGN